MNIIKITHINQNYFKDMNFEVDKNKFIVITGPSGSGKSTLVTDVIYAESQHKFFSSIPTYARKFINLPDEPDIDEVSGLTPCIIIDQKTSIFNIRSTVGTMSEIYDYLRTFFALIGEYFCPVCKKQMNKQSIYDIVSEIYDIMQNKAFSLELDITENYLSTMKDYINEGYNLFRLLGIPYSIKTTFELDSFILKVYSRKNKSLFPSVVLYDGIVNKDSLEDLLYVFNKFFDKKNYFSFMHDNIIKYFSTNYRCQFCNVIYDFPKIKNQLFSFNLPTGACQICRGTGLLVENYEKLDSDLSLDKEKKKCSNCLGAKLRREALAVYIDGNNISDLCNLSIVKLFQFFELFFEDQNHENKALYKVVKEIIRRLSLLINLGIGYLSLSRNSNSLSGGEIQRIRLAAQLGGGLSGVTYILDEPSIGLHQSDNGKLIKIICELRDLGNTIFVVEHDEETMLAADHIVDIGPGSGIFGGQIVFSGSPKNLLTCQNSVTAMYLNGLKKLERKTERKEPISWFIISHLVHNNLKNITAKIPIDNGLIVVFSGISGSGKSTLLFDEFLPAFLSYVYNSNFIDKKYILDHAELCRYDDVLVVDQKNIGACQRSTIGTYIGFFDEIRVLYASLPESKLRGFHKGDFSFNTGRFRCDLCKGSGEVTEVLYPLPSITVKCDKCSGMRFRKNILAVKYNNKNIFEVLKMSIFEAAEFFKNFKKIYRKLNILLRLGLGYINLNQTVDTFSGGEKQRIKLALSLSGRIKKILYIFDEPTTGLHFQDIAMLLEIFDGLVADGHSLFIIEHNINIIKYADYIVDMGPGGGEFGGEIVSQGSPNQVKNDCNSVTGRYL